MTRDQYEAALTLAQSYASVDPTPDSRYGQRLAELMRAIGEYEREHPRKYTHEDVQARVDRARGAT